MSTTLSGAPSAARRTERRWLRSLTVMLSALALLLGMAPAAQAQATSWQTRLGDFRFDVAVDAGNSNLVPGGHVRFNITGTNAYAGSIPGWDNRVLTTYGLVIPAGFTYQAGGGSDFDDVGNHGQGTSYWGGQVPFVERTVFPGGSRSGWLQFGIPADAKANVTYHFDIKANLETGGNWFTADDAVAFQIPAVQSATKVTVSPTVGRVNEAVTLRADVSAVYGSNVPAGSVTFAVDGQSIPANVVDGVATATARFATTGEKPVTATFTPANGAEWQASSGTGTVNIQSEVTQTDLTLDPVAIKAGDIVSATARLTPAAAAGDVVFTVDGQTQRIPVRNGVATADFRLTTSGTKTVRAHFEPTNPLRYTTSDDSATVTVSELTTTTAVTVTPATTTAGQRIELKAAITPSDATGTVTFEVAGRRIEATVVDGVATAYTSLDVAGTHPVTATFVSDQPTRWLGSTGSGSVRVNAEGTTTTVTVDPATVEVGGESVLTARVTPTDVPGIVEFVVDGKSYNADVVNGVATTRVLFSNTGNREVKATFKPTDSERYAESSDTATVTVNAAGGSGSLGSLGGDSLSNLTGSLGS